MTSEALPILCPRAAQQAIETTWPPVCLHPAGSHLTPAPLTVTASPPADAVQGVSDEVREGRHVEVHRGAQAALESHPRGH